MSLDEATLREWVHRVVHGMANRRAFLRYMMGLGLSGPFLGNLLATYAPAQAQTPAAESRCSSPPNAVEGGKLRLLWWQAPTILNTHLASGTKDLDASRVVYEPLAAFDPDANFVPDPGRRHSESGQRWARPGWQGSHVEAQKGRGVA